MKKILSTILFLSSSLSFAQMQTFKLQEVQLTPGIFKNAQDVDLEYILKMDPDKLLAPYLIDAELPIKKERYGNWESSGLDGHIGGHYLSALALMYASTGNSELLERLNYMVSVLAECQKKNGNGYVGGIPQGKVFWSRIKNGDIDGSSFGLNNSWVPLYNIHKVYAGLYDAYIHANNEQALVVLKSLSDWMIDMFSNLSDEQVEKVLRTEHGGLNEVFAALHGVTKEKKYLDLAERLTHKAFLSPLTQKKDKLTGLHANTQIPKLVGVEEVLKYAPNAEWQQGSEYFWDNVATLRSVAFGGNSYREHFHELDRFDKMLETNQGPETCNSYNMLKLSKLLYLRTLDTKYLDFYERILYNHILSSQHPEKGGFVYFTPIRPNHYRVYSQPHTSMWCCVGTGLENHAKYAELVYTHTNITLFVNFLMASSIHWKEVELEQITHFPEENSSSFTIKKAPKTAWELAVRIPKWMKNPTLFVNGKAQKLSIKNDFVHINRKWKSGDVVRLAFDTETQIEHLGNDKTWGAFVNGPIVLAQETNKKELPDLFADDSRMGHETHGPLYSLQSGHTFLSEPKMERKEAKKAVFTTDSLTLIPFYKIHESRYQMYFQFLSPEQYQKVLNAKSNDFENKNVVDRIQLGEQQPEADHGYKGEKSDSGYENGRFWRNTASYISYKLLVGEKNELIIESLEPNQNHFKVYINNEEVAMKETIKEKSIIDLSGYSGEISLKITPSEAGKSSPKLTQIIVLKP